MIELITRALAFKIRTQDITNVLFNQFIYPTEFEDLMKSPEKHHDLLKKIMTTESTLDHNPLVFAKRIFQLRTRKNKFFHPHATIKVLDYLDPFIQQELAMACKYEPDIKANFFWLNGGPFNADDLSQLLRHANPSDDNTKPMIDRVALAIRHLKTGRHYMRHLRDDLLRAAQFLFSNTYCPGTLELEHIERLKNDTKLEHNLKKATESILKRTTQVTPESIANAITKINAIKHDQYQALAATALHPKISLHVPENSPGIIVRVTGLQLQNEHDVTIEKWLPYHGAKMFIDDVITKHPNITLGVKELTFIGPNRNR